MVNLNELDSFGDIAAEDDAVLDYFLSTESVQEIKNGKKLLVLGKKGSGKTALVRYFTESQSKDHGKPLSLRNYPWGTHQKLIDKGSSPVEAYVASWRLLIAIRLASMVCLLGEAKYTVSLEALKTFLTQNFGTLDPEARAILTQNRLTVTGLTFAPQVAGISLGSITFGDPNKEHVLGMEINSLTTSILRDVTTAISKLGIKRLFLHFDELDQGLETVDTTRKNMLTGLILAAREISRSNELQANICPIVYLRTDIWEQLSFSDKNKITQSSAIHLLWNEKTLMELVNKRIEAKLGPSIVWEKIEDGAKMRGSQPKWAHILARTLLRPRDVIQFLNEALAIAKARGETPIKFCNDDINGCREAYSTYLKYELDDEIIPHWKEWEEALQACSKTTNITFQKVDFLKHYRQIKSKENLRNPEEALELLFKFSVVGYERRSGKGGSSWSFRYNDAAAIWDATAPRFKVHQGLKEFAKLKETRN